MVMKTLTLEDYQKAGEKFWPKYWYIAKELGEDAKPEQVLKVMEAIGGVALKQALEDKLSGPFGFNKKEKEDANLSS
jgi:hypothetical protein